jgi:hypothetical protein
MLSQLFQKDKIRRNIRASFCLVALASVLLSSGCTAPKSPERITSDRPAEKDITLALITHLIGQQKQTPGETPPVYFAAHIGLDGRYHDVSAAAMSSLYDLPFNLRKFSQIDDEYRECFRDRASKQCGLIVAVGLFEWANDDQVKVVGVVNPGGNAQESGCTYHFVRTAGKWSIKEFTSCFGN